MAYTRNWSDTTPAGSRAAKEIDDAMREKAVDIHERFLTLLRAPVAADEPFDDDPLVLKAEISGKQTDLVIPISPLSLVAVAGTVNPGTSQVEFDDEAHLPLLLVPGTHIKKFSVYVSMGSGTKVDMILQSVNMTNGTVTSLTPTVSRTAAGYGLLETAALDYTTIATEVYQVRFIHFGTAFPSPGSLRGGFLTRDRADNSLSY